MALTMVPDPIIPADAPSDAEILVRALDVSDGPAFVRFAAQVPEGERRFAKDDLKSPRAAFKGFLADPAARRVVAVRGQGEIVGFAGAFAGTGWSSHVAELRVLVSSAERRRGTGRLLAHAVLVEALTLGCTHVYIEVVAGQQSVVAMFEDLGFEPEALLGDFVRDSSGEFHDLMLLTHRVNDQWGQMQNLALNQAGTE